MARAPPAILVRPPPPCNTRAPPLAGAPHTLRTTALTKYSRVQSGRLGRGDTFGRGDTCRSAHPNSIGL